MASKVQPKILAAATELFSDFGYFGVTTRDLARKAKTTEGSLYRLFGSKEKVFEEALAVVVDQLLDPGQFLLALFENEQARKQDFASVMVTVLQRWYSSLPQKSARLLIQAYFIRPKLRHMKSSPYAPIDKIIDILATAIARAQKAHSFKMNERAAATLIILALLHFKTTLADTCNPKLEAETVDSFIHFWLNGLSS